MNIMTEFMGLIKGRYDAKEQGFVPGSMSLHNWMLPHGPDKTAFDRASHGNLSTVKLTDTLPFMFETRFPHELTLSAAREAPLQDDCAACWDGIEKHFDPNGGSGETGAPNPPMSWPGSSRPSTP